MVPLRPAALILSGVLAAVSAAASAAPVRDAKVKLRIAHTYDESHIWQKSFERFRDSLQARSGGTIEAQIFSGGQLCGEKECVSLMRQGVLDVTTVSANGLEAVAPEFTFVDLLYLWKDRDHWQRAFDGEVGQRLTDLIRKGSSKGGIPAFEILGYWGGSKVNMLSHKRGYETVDDLSGVKIRVQDSPLQLELWKSLGALPVSLPMDQIKDGLRDGVVDAVPLTNTTNLKGKFYEVAPHITEMEIAIVARVFLMSGHTWNKLTPDQRAIVTQAAKEATSLNRSLEAEVSDGALTTMARDLGVKLYPFKDRQRLRERLRPVQERYADRLGLLDLLHQIDDEWEKPGSAPRGKK
jgi:TRAP-type C4-dicarboxylate transport system substrate-binding protein